MEKIIDEAAKFGVHLTASHLEAFEKHSAALRNWSQAINLTAIQDEDGVRVKHFLDSLTCLQAMGRTPMQRVIDIGPGAGFPGLVLKVVHPEMHLTLVEAVEKKARFCQAVADELGLAGVEVIHGRAEEVGQDPLFRETFDWALARAVASLPVLVEYLLPLVRIGGKMLAQKGGDGLDETRLARRGIQILGGELTPPVPIHLPGIPDERCLVVIEKISATPPAYPRRPGVPKKHPLI